MATDFRSLGEAPAVAPVKAQSPWFVEGAGMGQENVALEQRAARVDRSLELEKENLSLADITQFNTVVGSAWNFGRDLYERNTGNTDYDTDALAKQYGEAGVSQEVLDTFASSRSEEEYRNRAERWMRRVNFEDVLANSGTGTQVAVALGAMAADMAVLWHPTAWAARVATGATMARTVAGHAAMGTAEARCMQQL